MAAYFWLYIFLARLPFVHLYAEESAGRRTRTQEKDCFLPIPYFRITDLHNVQKVCGYGNSGHTEKAGRTNPAEGEDQK